MATHLTSPVEVSLVGQGSSSAVSWPAIFAGAAAAAALSLILLVLGTGLGLAVISPWADSGASATVVSWSTILWIAFTAAASSSLGGYLAGRLRSRWLSVHNDEVYFRDTAHGFLAWAVATLLTAATLTSAVGTLLGAGAEGGAAVAAAGVKAAATAADAGSDDFGSALAYSVDSLFRAQATPSIAAQTPAASAATAGPGQQSDAAVASAKREMSGIFGNTLRSGPLPMEIDLQPPPSGARTGLSTQNRSESRRLRCRHRRSCKRRSDVQNRGDELSERGYLAVDFRFFAAGSFAPVSCHLRGLVAID